MPLQVSFMHHPAGNGHEGQRLLSPVVSSKWPSGEKEPQISHTDTDTEFCNSVQSLRPSCLDGTSFQTVSSGKSVYRKHKTSLRKCACQSFCLNIAQGMWSPVLKDNVECCCCEKYLSHIVYIIAINFLSEYKFHSLVSMHPDQSCSQYFQIPRSKRRPQFI